MKAEDKPERRSAAVMIRLKPSTKALAEKRAREERRSLTNYLEGLILADAAAERDHKRR